MITKYKLQTDVHGVHDITEEVKKAVAKTHVVSGLCCVYIPHTTAAVTVFSGDDPLGFQDINDEIKKLVPVRTDFHHQCDGMTDAAGHIKSSFLGVSMTFIIDNGQLVLGRAQRIYFFEFDGPRDREFIVKVIEG